MLRTVEFLICQLWLSAYKLNSGWVQVVGQSQTPLPFTSGVDADLYGYVVAISADGGTALVGAPLLQVGSNTQQVRIDCLITVCGPQFL
jgi:hypothetical protein